jgi:hypothetical protein
MAADGLPGFEAWAALADGELAGALFTARIGDTVCVPYAMSRSKYLQNHVNNVLFFKTATNILAREEISCIFFTVQSLDAPESVDEFKLRMGLMPKPVRQRVVLNPLVSPLATNLVYAAISRLLKRYPNSNLIAKAEGMLRFNRLGRLPLADQQWPECVAQYKDSVVSGMAQQAEKEWSVTGPAQPVMGYKNPIPVTGQAKTGRD